MSRGAKCKNRHPKGIALGPVDRCAHLCHPFPQVLGWPWGAGWGWVVVGVAFVASGLGLVGLVGLGLDGYGPQLTQNPPNKTHARPKSTRNQHNATLWRRGCAFLGVIWVDLALSKREGGPMGRAVPPSNRPNRPSNRQAPQMTKLPQRRSQRRAQRMKHNGYNRFGAKGCEKNGSEHPPMAPQAPLSNPVVAVGCCVPRRETRHTQTKTKKPQRRPRRAQGRTKHDADD